MLSELAILTYLLHVKTGLPVVIGVLAPAATYRHYLLRRETKFRLKRFATVRALALLRSSVDPMMVRRLLFSVLSHSYVTKTRFAREIQGRGANDVSHHATS